jgi:flavin reductase (DIM6/NTAB) family NADH-FMN oxidoreductase RutF
MDAAVPDHEQLITQTRFALRRLASGVAVVSCREGQARHAMTATAVNALSMQPPSMIICINRASRFHRAVSAATHYAINILHRSQIDVSKGCGGEARGEDRFGYGAWDEADGIPTLTDAQARIVCANEARLDYGSHTIFVGRVTFVAIHGEIDPLIYVDGRYTCLPSDALPASALQTEIEILRQFAI